MTAPIIYCREVPPLTSVYKLFLTICIQYFLQIDGVPGLAVTLFSLLLELHKDEEMARNSVDEQVRQAIRQHYYDVTQYAIMVGARNFHSARE